MKISCEGKNRAMYNHTLFDGEIRYNSGVPSIDGAGFRYDPSENEMSIKFYTGYITLGGEYTFEIKQSVEEILELIPNMLSNPHHKSAALSQIAAMKVLLAEEMSH